MTCDIDVWYSNAVEVVSILVCWHSSNKLSPAVHLSYLISFLFQSKTDVFFYPSPVLCLFLSCFFLHSLSHSDILFLYFVYFTFCILLWPCNIHYIYFNVACLSFISLHPPFFQSIFIVFLSTSATIMLLLILLSHVISPKSWFPYFHLILSLPSLTSLSVLLSLTELFQRRLEYFWLCDSSGQHYWHPGDRDWGK